MDIEFVAQQLTIILIYIAIFAFLIFIIWPIRLHEDKHKNNIARVLSVLVPGLGHVYLGKWVRGILILLIWVILIIMFVKSIFQLLAGDYKNMWEILGIMLGFWLFIMFSLSGIIKRTRNKEEATALK